MRYNLFENEMSDLQGVDLARLADAAEGWYVEYKAQPIRVKDFGKSLSAFANQYGGWLIIGVEEAKDGSRVAGAFPGVDVEQVPAVERALRDASRDCVHPPVFYEHKIIVGPVTAIGLLEKRAIVVVRIPPGVDTPYVHNDGRIYRRVADSSAPVAEHDRHALDSLWQKGQSARRRLERLATRLPVVSKGEADNPYLHVFVSHDPLEQSNKYHPSDLSSAVAVMKGEPVPFDNVYPRSGGLVARQAKGNPHGAKLFTWEFSREGHSFFTVPLPYFDFRTNMEPLRLWLSGYEHGDRFIDSLSDVGFESARILDVNFLLFIAGAIVSRHRALLRGDDVFGPFYVKAQLENVWRCVPFLDLPTFLEQVKADGIPVVQDSTVLCPPGSELESFDVLPVAAADACLTLERFGSDGLAVAIPLWLGLGVSAVALANGARDVAYTGDRAKVAQERRTAARRLTPR